MLEAHALSTLLLTLCALAFRLAGARPLLNTFDYSSIRDPAAFNRYVAHRMLLPVAVSAACTLGTAAKPALGLPLLFLMPLSILAVVIWVGVGSRRFQAAGA